MRESIDEFLQEQLGNAYAVSVFTDGRFDYVTFVGGFSTPSWGCGHVEGNDVVLDN